MARIMLALAWLIAPICSLPQIFVFRLKTHPLMEEYRWIMLLLFSSTLILVVILMFLMVWLNMSKAFDWYSADSALPSVTLKKNFPIRIEW